MAATEEEKVARAKEFAETWATQATEDLREILKGPGGRRVVWSVLEECGVYADTFRGEDTHASSYEQGKRKVGLTLLEKVFTADPNAYTLMRHEAVMRAKEREKYING